MAVTDERDHQRQFWAGLKPPSPLQWLWLAGQALCGIGVLVAAVAWITLLLREALGR